MRSVRGLAGCMLLLCLAACGGSAVPPTPAVPLYSVDVVGFYDENGNGLQDGNEHAVVPGVTVSIYARTAQTASGTGQAALIDIPAGTWTIQVKPSTLPPFYQAPAAVQVSVPVLDGQPVGVPMTLPIGNNQPNTYMAFGDSITDGDGSSDNNGYRLKLQDKLDAWFNAGQIINQAIGGTRSDRGAQRIGESLASVHPAYTLIMYGTNDWNDVSCQLDFPCVTVNSLRDIVRSVKAAGGLPVLSTILPCNTGYDARTPPERNQWVAAENALLKPMAAQEGALFVDTYSAFMSVPDFHTLFSDHVHPNDAGYTIIADQFFAAITTPPVTAAAAATPEPLIAPPHLMSPRPLPPDPADVERPPRWGQQPKSLR
jgi:lysophospholipase L1-like esterase